MISGWIDNLDRIGAPDSGVNERIHESLAFLDRSSHVHFFNRSSLSGFTASDAIVMEEILAERNYDSIPLSACRNPDEVLPPEPGILNFASQ